MRRLALAAMLWASPAWAQVDTSSAAVDTASVAMTPKSPSPAPTSRVELVEPEVGAFGVYLRVGSVIPSDDDFGAVSELGALVRVELGGSWSFAPEWSLELGIAHGSPSANSLGRFELGLAATSLQAAVVYRRPVLWGIDLHGRAMLSGDLGRFTADDGSAPTVLEDTAFGVGGALAVGLSVAVPYVRLFVEGGYQLHSGFAFGSVERDVVSSTDPARIERGSVEAGTISLSGAMWRLGLALTF